MTLAEKIIVDLLQQELSDEKIIVNLICPFCNKEHIVKVKAHEWALYQYGELAQNAFPQLTPTEREQIISHLCPQCQSKVFG